MNKWRVEMCRCRLPWCKMWTVLDPGGVPYGRHPTFAKAIDHADQRARYGSKPMALSVKVFGYSADR